MRDRATGTNLLISRAPDGYSGEGASPIWLSPDGTTVLFSAGGGASHYGSGPAVAGLFLVAPGSAAFEPVSAGGRVIDGTGQGITSDLRHVVFFSRQLGVVDHQATAPDGSSISYGYVLDRDTGEIVMVSAAEDGTPGIIPRYTLDPDGTFPVDYVPLAVSGDGRRIVFATIQYGIVGGDAIPCLNSLHFVYLRDCT